MGTKAWSTVAIILLVSTTLYASKTVGSIVSASHLMRHGDEVKETRIHLLRDHRLYVEEISQESSSHPTGKMSLAVLPEPAFQRIVKLMASRHFAAIQDRYRHDETKLRQDEIWHIVFRDGTAQFFTFNPPQLHPPTSFVEWFDQSAPPPLPVDQENWHDFWVAVRDARIIGVVRTSGEWLDDFLRELNCRKQALALKTPG